MIGRSFKNIWRLKRLYLPLFVSLCFFFMLNLICSSVIASCSSAIDSIETSYTAHITLTVNERMELVLDSNGNKNVVNTNNALIDTDTLNILNHDQRLSGINYITNSFNLPVGIICTDDQLKEIEKCVSTGRAFVNPPSSFHLGQLIISEVNAVGVTDISISGRAVDENIIYVSDSRVGAILPLELYELYDRPESLVFGWKDAEFLGLNISETENGYVLSEHLLSIYKEAIQSSSAPNAYVSVIGYFENSSETNTVVFDAQTWEEIYSVRDHYNTLEESDNALDDIGIKYLTAEVSSPSVVENVIRDLIDNGLNVQDYLISANDYNYKFAKSQIESAGRFAKVIYAFSFVICLLIGAIIVYYTIRRRGKETTILWLLGYPRINIFCGVICEVVITVFSSFAVSIFVHRIVGFKVCELINLYISDRARSSIDKMSKITQFMIDGEVFYEQLEGAIESFSSVGFKLNYQLWTNAYFVVLLICILLVLFAAVVLTKQISLNYAKIGELNVDS